MPTTTWAIGVSSFHSSHRSIFPPLPCCQERIVVLRHACVSSMMALVMETLTPNEIARGERDDDLKVARNRAYMWTAKSWQFFTESGANWKAQQSFSHLDVGDQLVIRGWGHSYRYRR